MYNISDKCYRNNIINIVVSKVDTPEIKIKETRLDGRRVGHAKLRDQNHSAWNQKIELLTLFIRTILLGKTHSAWDQNYSDRHKNRSARE